MAKLLPLKGKFYGSEIELSSGETITVWLTPKDGEDWCTPSERQLEQWGMSLQEAKDDDMMCDSHFENQRTYRVAMKIVEALAEEDNAED